MAKQNPSSKKTAKSTSVAARPGEWLAGAKGFTRDVRSEMRKVTWPGRRQVVVSTGVVLATTIIMGLYIGGLDLLFTYVVKAIGL